METREEIIGKIRAGIPQGAYGEQVKYLQRMIGAYAGHPDGREIERFCNQWIAELLPRDKREAIAERLRQELSAVQAKLDQIRELLRTGKSRDALALADELAEAADRRPVPEDDGESAYFNFTEPFERTIYIEIERRSGRNGSGIAESAFPYFHIYALQGAALMDAEQYSRAMDAFKKASYWDPANAEVRFRYISAFFSLGKGERTWSLCGDTMKYLFRRTDIARCYSLFAQCYLCGGVPEAALACLLLSERYHPEERGQAELRKLMRDTGAHYADFSPEKLSALAEKYAFPLEPEKTAVELAERNGLAAMDTEPELAAYFLEIAYALSPTVELADSLARAKRRAGKPSGGDEN